MPRTMHQTTVRFGAELWQELMVAADAEGVSVAQYVRESAVARLARGGSHVHEAGFSAQVAELRRQHADAIDETSALMAQSRLARTRSERLRFQAAAARDAQPAGD